MRKSPIGLMQRIAAGRGVLSARAQQIVSINAREESILAKMFGLQYMIANGTMAPSGSYIIGPYVVGIYVLLYCAVSTITEDDDGSTKRARE